MKIIAKTRAVLFSNDAESMIEVIVAFAVMTIILSLFAQGIRFANSAQVYAIEKTKDSDIAMQNLQDTVNGNSNKKKDSGVTVGSDDFNGDLIKLKDKNGNDVELLKLKRYSVTFNNGGDSNTYYYFVFDAI
jgi:hypothetical protein